MQPQRPSKIFLRALAAIVLAAGGFLHAEPNLVQLEKTASGKWMLLRNGQPFFIKGAAGPSRFDQLRAAGGNSMRTYGIRQLEARDEDGRTLLDRAHAAGLAVTIGLYIPQKRHGFQFDNPAQFLPLREQIRADVRKYKDHPALLLWGLGGEVELASERDDPAMWNELNELARIVKEEDPNHPVMTAIAGASPKTVGAIMRHYPELDILGVDTYDRPWRLHQQLAKIGWKKPYIMAEYGTDGYWSVQKTAWDAPVEPTSEEKAAMYARALKTVSEEGAGQFLGSYVFFWGNKQEATATWFSLFLPTGERTAAIDALTLLWNGQPPANRCPEITEWEIPFAEKTIRPGATAKISIKARDPENDPLAITWWVTPESVRISGGTSREKEPPLIPNRVSPENAASAKFTAPSAPGDYRLFVKAVDTHNNASVRNTPFRVAE